MQICTFFSPRKPFRQILQVKNDHSDPFCFPASFSSQVAKHFSLLPPPFPSGPSLIFLLPPPLLLLSFSDLRESDSSSSSSSAVLLYAVSRCLWGRPDTDVFHFLSAHSLSSRLSPPPTAWNSLSWIVALQWPSENSRIFLFFYF